MKNACIVIMRCITNMHVGSGEVNYNIIDNEVERDPVTGYPVVNASGVKGALRNYFETADKESVDALFGSGSDKQRGSLKILGAEMIAIPQRASGGEGAFYLITTDAAVARCNELSRTLIDRELIRASEGTGLQDKSAEGKSLLKEYTFNTCSLYTVGGNQSEEQIVLPVLARNCLENGKSKNLWYEEVVPHESLFFFGVIADDEAALDAFLKQTDGKIVQFGANATIGYGLCRLTAEKEA